MSEQTTFTSDGEIPLGITEAAELFGVKRSTVNQWRQRKVLPQPDMVVSGAPLWWRKTLTAWGESTSRLPTPSRSSS